MDRFPEKQPTKAQPRQNFVSTFFMPLINAGVRRENKERQLEMEQQLEELNEFLSEENVKERSYRFASWFRKTWPAERCEERQIEIRNYLEDNFPALNEKTTKDNIKIKTELENIFKRENNFAHRAECRMFLGPKNNIMHDPKYDCYVGYMQPTLELQFSFDSKLIWFYTPKGSLDTENIINIIKFKPEHSQQIMDNLRKPFIELPIDVPKSKDAEIQEKLAKFIIDKRQSESAVLMGTSLTEFQKAYNRAVSTKELQTVEGRCQIIPVVKRFSVNGIENTNVNYLIIKPLFDID